MMQRCFNPNNKAYCYYGERGIIVCERWLKFKNFYADMGDPPPGLSIDRIDVNGNYEPGNCRWATQAEQLANRRPPKRKLGNVRIYGSRMIKREARRAKLMERQKFVASLARAATTPGGVRREP
jgi:hypothetical protein